MTGLLQLDRENHLLCEILRLDQQANEIHHRNLPAHIDEEGWIALVNQAVRHELAALLYQRHHTLLKQIAMPDRLMGQLRLLYLTQLNLSLKRKEGLGQLLLRLADRGTPVIVLKGAYLGEIVYEDPACRPMGDIDLLVCQERLPETVDVLESLGYRSSRKFWLEIETPTGHQLPTFLHPESASVELHWRLCDLVSGQPYDMDPLWQRATMLTIAGQPAMGLGPEDLLLYLCQHAANHPLYYGLRAIYDVALTAAHFGDRMNWSMLPDLARAWSQERSAFLLLWLASELLMAPIPSGLLVELRPADFGPRESSLALQLVFHDPLGEFEVPHNLFRLAETHGFTARMRLILSQLFLPPSVMRQHYGVAPHTWKVLLYYPVHWVDLLRRGLRIITAKFRRDEQTLQRTRVDLARQRLQEELAGWLRGG